MAVEARVRELLRASKVQDLVSAGEWGDMLLDKIAKAEADGNHNAVMQGLRLLGQGIGTLKDNVALSIEQRVDDATLLERLAGDDPAKLAALRTILGAADTFDETRH